MSCKIILGCNVTILVQTSFQIYMDKKRRTTLRVIVRVYILCPFHWIAVSCDTSNPQACEGFFLFNISVLHIAIFLLKGNCYLLNICSVSGVVLNT